MTSTLYLLFIVSVTASLVALHKKFDKLQALPLVLLLYVTFMLLGNLNLWEHHDPSISEIQKRSIDNLLPAMIFLMMLGFDIKLFKQLGRKMLVAFFATTISLVTAFITLFYLFKPLLWMDAAKSFATLAGSWSGGTINMIAVGKVVGIDQTALSSVIIVDTILYTLWVMFLLLLVPFAAKFNAYTKSDIKIVEFDLSCCINTDTRSYIRIIFISIIIAYGVNILALNLPQSSFISTSFYAVILATLFGLIGSKSFLNRLPAQSVANSMLYLIIALIASKASFTDVSTTLLFLVVAALILILHAVIMIAFAKLFRLDLFSLGVASLAHIGGTAGATILASSYHKTLIPIAVIMATAGYLLGTMVGLFIAFSLNAF